MIKHFRSLLNRFLDKGSRSPVRREIRHLERRIQQTDNYMKELSDQFWEDGGVCCPNCGVPGYSELEAKQERRVQRLLQLRRKLL